MDILSLGLADHWPCRFCGGAGGRGRGTSSTGRGSPSGLGLGVVADPGLGEIHRFCRAGAAGLFASCAGSLGGSGSRGTEGRGEPLGELILRLEFDDVPELRPRPRLCVPAPCSGRRAGIGRPRCLDSAARSPRVRELLYIGVDVRIEPDHRRPVPAWSRREDGVRRGGRLLVALEREQDEGPELVQDRVVWRLGEGLVGERQRPGVVARPEFLPRRRRASCCRYRRHPAREEAPSTAIGLL